MSDYSDMRDMLKRAGYKLREKREEGVTMLIIPLDKNDDVAFCFSTKDHKLLPPTPDQKERM
jgi:hypothetical protein